MTGSIKDYTPNFEFIIPEFNITGWHDYLEENFRSIDALFYNLFGINNFKGQWKNSTVYNVDEVVFVGEDTDYSGRLVKVLVQHTTAGTGNFTEFFTANPSYYELFADASTAQLYAQEAKDWAVKLDGPVQDDLYSSKFYANIVNGLSTEITTLYNIRSDIQTVSNIGTAVVNVADNETNINTVASMQSDINDVLAIKSDIEWIADNDTIVTNVSNNSTKITTVANNISSVNTTATNITDINTVASISSNVSSVAGNSTNINTVASNNTNITSVVQNISSIVAVNSNVTNINTVSTNISDVNTAASNITVIQNAPTYATNAQNSASLAQDWATKTNGLVDNTDYSAKHYAEIAQTYGHPLYVGEIIQSSIPLTDAGLHLLDGTLIQGNGIYSEFVTFIASLVSTYPNLFISENDWQTSVTNYGVCGKFVYDSVNNTVRLPKITGFTEGTLSSTSLGDLTEAGLPNITGTYTDRDGFYNNNIGTGVFRQINSSATGNYVGAAQNNRAYSIMEFDASQSNSIYGNSSTVQPQSIKVLYYIVIATSTKTDIQVDIDEIATDLNGKADVDLSNTNLSTFATKMNTAGIRTVIETYSNGTNWYRIYSDGWCEQGGISTGAIPETVTLLKPYKDTNGNILITPKSSSTPTAPAGNPIASWISNSQIQVSSSQSYWAVFWETKGYIA